jgi:hypothetical protein
MCRGSFICACCVKNVIHKYKDSNKYDIWVIVKSINIGARTPIIEKKLPGGFLCKNNDVIIIFSYVYCFHPVVYH